MSDEAEEGRNSVEEEKPLVGWVYNLRKEQAEAELNKRNIAFDSSDNLDKLRRLIVKDIKKNKQVQKLEEDQQSKTTGVQLQSEGSSDSDESSADLNEIMTNDIPKLEFCLDKSDWEIFIERLEIYFSVKGTANDKKVATALIRFDEDAFKLLKSLCAPKQPFQLTYDELKRIMKEQLNPAPSEVMERCNFNQAKQEQTETIAVFAAKLKKLALTCNFGDQLASSLRDQFVCGLRDHETRIELFKKTELTFELAYKEAVARETAVSNAVGSQKVLGTKETQQRSVYAMNQTNQGRAANNKSRNKPAFQHPNSTTERNTNTSKQQENTQ